MTRAICAALLCCACAVDLTGALCRGDDNCPRQQFCDVGGQCRSSGPIEALALSPPSAVVPRGGTFELAALATIGRFQRDVTALAAWQSSSPLVAGVDAGTITALETGTAEIAAELDGKRTTGQLVVIPAALEAIELSPANPQVPRGASAALVANGRYSNGTTAEVTSLSVWTTSSPLVAEVSNTSGTRGRVTGAEIGSATISATVDGVSGSTVVFVTEPALLAMELSPATPSIAVGTTQQFVATGTYSDGSTRDVSSLVAWRSAAPDVATVSDASGSKGLATGRIAGIAGISAAAGAVSAGTRLQVTNAGLVSLAVSPAQPSIARGTSLQLTATGTFSDNTTQDVTAQALWESLAPAVASVSNSDGSRGAATGLSTGTATLRATLAARSGTTTLTVTDATLSSLAVTPVNPSLAKGTQQQFAATGLYSDNSTQDLTAVASWSSSAQQIVSVSDAAGTKGLAAAHGAGSATLTAQVSGKSGTSVVTVPAATLSTIALSAPSATLAVGTRQQYTATGTYSDGSAQDVTQSASWSSSRLEVALVSNAAASRGEVTAVDGGTTLIAASLGTVTSQAMLSVTLASLVSIAVSPPNPSLPKGTTRQLVATGSYSDGSTQDLTARVLWISSDEQRVSVSNAAGSHGMATAVNFGMATVGASLGGVSGSTTVTVSAASLQAISITPTNPTIPRQALQQFTATGSYSDGTFQPLTLSATWASSNVAVAAISNATMSKGRATATGPGVTTISASQTGSTGQMITGQTSLTVSP